MSSDAVNSDTFLKTTITDSSHPTDSHHTDASYRHPIQTASIVCYLQKITSPTYTPCRHHRQPNYRLPAYRQPLQRPLLQTVTTHEEATNTTILQKAATETATICLCARVGFARPLVAETYSTPDRTCSTPHLLPNPLLHRSLLLCKFITAFGCGSLYSGAHRTAPAPHRTCLPPSLLHSSLCLCLFGTSFSCGSLFFCTAPYGIGSTPHLPPTPALA